MFDYQQPCPPSQTIDIPVRTTTFVDGAYELKVTVTNAAQNVSTVLRRTITINNRTTISTSGTSSVDVVEADAPPGAAPVYALVLDAATQALLRGVRSRFAKSGLSLSGTLRNSAGVPAPGVPVRLIAQNAGESTPAVVATTTSDAAGHWVLNAPAGALTQADDRLRHADPDPRGRRDDQPERQADAHAARPRARPRPAAVHRPPRDRAAGLTTAARRHPGAQRQALASRRLRRARHTVRAVHADLPGAARQGSQGDRRRQLRISRRRTVDTVISHRNVSDQKDEGPLMRATTNRGRTRIAGGLTLATLVLALTASVAGAASPAITRQATSANAVFLAYAPAPPAAAKALCLVDTGVNATPDTTPGLVSATALDGGTGADVDPLWHGTINAAIAGGAGHGVLGAWPQLKIVSVRATDIPSPGQKPSVPVRRLHQGHQRLREQGDRRRAGRGDRAAAVVGHPADTRSVRGVRRTRSRKRSRRGSRSSPRPATSRARRSCPAASRGSSRSAPATAAPSRARSARRRA